jgi:hypothetical protein
VTRTIETARRARKARTRKAFAIAACVAALGVLSWTAAVGSEAVARAADTPSPQPTVEPTAAKPAGTAEEATISFDDYLAGVAKAGLTDAQRQELAGKYDGRKVTWTGYMRAVSKNKSPDGDSFVLIVKSKPVGEPPPAAFVAWLGLENETVLSALQENQKVTVSGTLFLQQNPMTPQLKDATLEE